MKKPYFKTVSLAIASVIVVLSGLEVAAYDRYLPSQTKLTQYENGTAVSKQTMTYSYNSKKLIKQVKNKGKILDENKWTSFSDTLKPKYTFYSNGKIKKASKNIPWSTYKAGPASYNKKGCITKRNGENFTASYSYKKGRIAKITLLLNQGDYTQKVKANVKYTYYKNKKVKTMSANLSPQGKYTLTFNKSGLLTKIVDKHDYAPDSKTYKIKYTIKKKKVTKMKVYVNGKIYRQWTFKYGKKKVSSRGYCSFINSMAAIKNENGPLLDIVQIFNLDNAYKNVF